MTAAATETAQQHHPWRPNHRPQHPAVAIAQVLAAAQTVAAMEGATERQQGPERWPRRKTQGPAAWFNLLDIAPSGYVVGQGATPPWNPHQTPRWGRMALGQDGAGQDGMGRMALGRVFGVSKGATAPWPTAEAEGYG